MARTLWLCVGILWAGVCGGSVYHYLSPEGYPSILGWAIFWGLISIGAFIQSAISGIRAAIQDEYPID